MGKSNSILWVIPRIPRITFMLGLSRFESNQKTFQRQIKNEN